MLNGPSAERHGRVSPDGKWLAYISNETGADHLKRLWLLQYRSTGSHMSLEPARSRETENGDG